MGAIISHGPVPRPMAMAITAETLFHMGRCLPRMAMATTAETLFRMGRCLHRMAMATTAATCVSFSFPFQIQDRSGLQANPSEAGVSL